MKLLGMDSAGGRVLRTARLALFVVTICLFWLGSLFVCGAPRLEGSLHRPSMGMFSYVSLEEVEPLVGGRRGFRRGRYVGFDGFVQINRHSSDGLLLSLDEGRVDTSDLPTLSRQACEAVPIHKSSLSSDSTDLVTDYFPAFLVLRFNLNACGDVIAEIPADMLSTQQQRLSYSMARLVSEASLSPSEPGLYVQSVPLSTDTRAFPPDLKFGDSMHGWHAGVRQAFERQMAMVRVAVDDKNLELGQGDVLERNRPLLVLFDDKVFMLASYWLDPSTKR